MRKAQIAHTRSSKPSQQPRTRVWQHVSSTRTPFARWSTGVSVVPAATVHVVIMLRRFPVVEVAVAQNGCRREGAGVARGLV